LKINQGRTVFVGHDDKKYLKEIEHSFFLFISLANFTKKISSGHKVIEIE
jgi:hypothetical protein